MFPCFTYAWRRSTTCSWPTTSASFCGRYFSTQISFRGLPARGNGRGSHKGLGEGAQGHGACRPRNRCVTVEGLKREFMPEATRKADTLVPPLRVRGHRHAASEGGMGQDLERSPRGLWPPRGGDAAGFRPGRV